MRLTLPVIRYALSEKFGAVLVSSHARGSFASPVFLAGYDQDCSGSIIVISAQDLGEFNPHGKRYSDTLFVCSGTLERVPQGLAAPIIQVAGEESVFLLFNELQMLYRRFEEWENSLQRCCIDDSGFEGLLELSDLLFHHPVALQDKDFRLIAFSDFAIESYILDYANDDKYLDVDVVGQLLANGKYARLIRNDDAYAFDLQVVKGIAINIKLKGEFVGMIIVNCPDYDEITLGYYAEVLRTIASYALRLLEARGRFSDLEFPSSAIRKLMREVFEDGCCRDDGWEKALLDSGWAPNDYLQLMAIRLSDESLVREGYCRKEIERTLAGSVLDTIGDYFVVLVDLDVYASLSGRTLQSDLVSLADRAQLFVGLSRSFSGWTVLPSALLEAKTALEWLGDVQQCGIRAESRDTDGRCKPTSSCRCVWFDDIAPDLLLLQGLSVFKPERICSSAAMILVHHDRKHGTDYFGTLYTYVANRFNAVATARDLCIQRSTLFYRLNKITGMTGFDLDATCGDDMAYLAMSLMILEKCPPDVREHS